MITKKSKILFILSLKSHIEYYFNDFILGELNKKFEVEILVPESLRTFLPSDYKKNVYFIETRSFNFNKKIINWCFELSAWRLRKKSKSFKYRETRISLPFTYINFLKNINKILSKNQNADFRENLLIKSPHTHQRKKLSTSIILFIIKGNKIFIHRILIRLFSYNPIYFIIQLFIFRRITVPSNIYNFCKEGNFQLVLYVSSGFEPAAYHIPKISNTLGKPSLMIADNWDNMSSKTSLWELPSLVATWGPQSSSHAVKIQGFNSNQVHNLGTARFATYPTIRNSKIEPHFTFNYVLFVGTVLNFNEQVCLEIISQEILSKPKIYGNLKIVYRPHPHAQKRKKVLEFNNFENVILDPQIKSIVENEFKSNYDINYLPSLISNAQLIVGGLTSVVVEASIFGKKFIGLAHREKFNTTSPHRVYAGYEHFKEIESLPNFFLCKKLDDLNSIFYDAWFKSNLTQAEIDLHLSHFYDISGDTYINKLVRIINNGINLKFE
jgi:hypothetical protein